jgi:hypothetical protein
MDRQNNLEKESHQLNLWTKLLDQQRKSFEYADAGQYILDEKCDTDLIYIQDRIVEWSKSAKNDNQKKVLNEMFLCLLRCSSYIDVIRTLSKQSVAKYVTAEKRITALHSEIRLMEYDKNGQIAELKKQLENAKKEIEFRDNNQ